MNIGYAIEAAKAGEKVARQGWNGKNMFIVYMSPLNLPPYDTQGTERKVNDRTAKWIGESTPLESLGYFAMFTANKKWQPGWLASQSDLLADDWFIAEEEVEVLELPPIPQAAVTSYSKKDKTYMYPYEIGMSMQGISLDEGIIPREGGMIAFDDSNANDRWYLTPEYLEVHYSKD